MKEPNQNHKDKGQYPYGSHYDSSTSPNAQNMRETNPGMPLESDNARVDLSTDPLSGLDEQNDTGSCTGAEFGGYGRYSNGYTGNPEELKSQNSIHRTQNPTASTGRKPETHATSMSDGKQEAADAKRRNIVGLCLALAVSAAALGAAGWLSGGDLFVTDPGTTGSETAETPETSVEESAPVDASQEDIPKTENFVLDYEQPEESSTETASLPEEDPSTAEVTGEEETETAENTETASLPEEETTAVDSEAVSTPSTPEQFVLPVEGAVTNPYSQGELVKSKTLGEWRTHDGIDLAAPEGTPVLSIADGLVEAVREDARWGNTIEVNYGDYTAYYYGLGDEIQVEAGDAVTAGQTLGEAGNSSLIEAEEVPHIHLGVKEGDNWVDPAVLLGLDGMDEENTQSEAGTEESAPASGGEMENSEAE